MICTDAGVKALAHGLSSNVACRKLDLKVSNGVQASGNIMASFLLSHDYSCTCHLVENLSTVIPVI